MALAPMSSTATDPGTVEPCARPGWSHLRALRCVARPATRQPYREPVPGWHWRIRAL